MKNGLSIALIAIIMIGLSACGGSSQPKTSNSALIGLESEQNSQPQADSKALFLYEDTQTNILLSGYDQESEKLTYRFIQRPKHGTISGTIPHLVYIPDEDFFGTDTLRYACSDGSKESQIATVSLFIQNKNDAPETMNQNILLKTETLSLLLLSQDTDGGQLSYTITKEPQHGVLIGTAPNLTYQPESGYKGVDSFSYTSNDGDASSNESTITIQTQTGNSIPQVTTQHLSFSEGTVSKKISLQASDEDANSTLQYMITKSPKRGELISFDEKNGKLIYKPNSIFIHGEDQFEFTVTDGQDTAQPATIYLHIQSVNNRPTAKSQSLALAEDTNVSMRLRGADIDYDSLSFKIKEQPSHGTLSGELPNLVYTPDKNFYGLDSFIFASNDGKLDSKRSKVSITVKENVRFNQKGFTRGSAGDIHLSKDGNYAYVSGGYNSYGKGFKIFDIQDDTNPKVIASLSTEGWAEHIAISPDEKIAYVTDKDKGVKIINIEDKTNPVEITIWEQGQPRDIVFSSDGTKLYCLASGGSSNSEYKGLFILDVSDSSNPMLLGSYKDFYFPKGLNLSADGKYIYVADYRKLHVIDVTNPKQPTKVQSSQNSNAYNIVVTKDGTKAYLNTGGGVVTYNVDTNGLLHKVAYLQKPSGSSRTNISEMILSNDEKRLYIAWYEQGVFAIDTQENIIVGSFKTQKTASSIMISADDTRLYTGDKNDGFEVIEVSIPQN